MKFCLVSVEKAREDNKRVILQEAQKLFDSVLYAPMEKIRIECRNGKTKVMFKEIDLSKFDVVYVRVFGNDFVFGEILLDALNSLEVFTPNPAEAFQVCNHKYYTIKQINKIGVPVPGSSLSVSPEMSLHLAHKIGFPAVVKLLSGFGGKGVMLVNSEKEFVPILDTLKVFEEFVATQEFVCNSNSDIRYLVLGKEVLGFKRTGAEGEWRANVSLGGKAEEIEVSEDMKEMSLKSAELLGLEVCAVDFLMTSTGPQVVEINFTPGIFYDFFKNKVGRKLVKFLHSRAKEIIKEKTALVKK